MAVNELLYAKCLATVAPQENLKMGLKPTGTIDGFAAKRQLTIKNGRVLTAEEKAINRRKRILSLLPMTCADIAKKLKVKRDLIKRDLTKMTKNGTVKSKKMSVQGMMRPVYYPAEEI